MEMRTKNTTAGVLFWTPAPARLSPTSDVASEDEWEDEDEEMPAEKDEDFHSQMDENGIIGLNEALEDVDLGQNDADEDGNCNPPWYATALNTEEACPGGLALELSYDLSELQDTPPLYDAMGGSGAVWPEDEELRQLEEEEQRWLKEKNGEGKKKRDELSSRSGSSTTGPQSPVLPHLRHFFSEELADVSAIEAETFPETGFTESLPESRSSRLSHTSKADWSHESEGEELKSRASSKPAAISPEQDMSNTLSTVSIGSIGRSGKSTINRHQRPTPAPRKMKQHSPETTRSKTRSLNKAGSSKSSYQTASPDRGQRTPRESPFKTQAKTISAEGDEARKGPLSYRTPDFSKIEPRVHFPKSGYKPPKSRGSPKKNVESVEPPLVFKSPAEIVREVLLCSTDGLPPLTDSNSPSACGPNSTVPEEFRCPQQATTLIEQLQEDYNRLLTKYAEAENTIDRLRLEAKVNLYSDPPKPGHSVQSGAIQDGSKLMMLNFPQAQRADISSSSVPQNAPGPHQRASPHPPSAASPRPPSAASISSSRSSGLQTGQQVTRTLSEQANKFLWQVQTFEDLLKSRKLKPFEAMTGLTQLVQGLDSLERSYLAVKEEHGLLQHRGAEKSPFDPDRELEGLIFQCGMCVEELKEQVEQMGQDPPTYKAPPHLTPSPVPTEGGESTPPPESPVFPVPEESVGVEVNSASGESDGVEEAAVEDEPLNYKHLLVEEEDFSTLMDHYQSLEELPTLLDGRLEEVFTLFPGAGNGVQPGEDERDGPYQVTGSLEDQNSLPQSGSRRIEAAKSHSSSLTSLGESASSERRGSKLQPGPRRILSQDRIISPETDSGFVGSESSHRTPAAVPSCLHQRAPASSVSVPQDGSSGKSQAGPVSQQPLPASSPSHRRTSLENSSSGGSQLSNPEHLRGRPRRTSSRERRCTCSSPSSSPPCWASQMPQTRADSGTSEFGLDSEHSHTASDRDDGQNGQFAESTNSQRSYRPSPSPATPPYRHGDPLRVLDSGQVTNRNEAIQNLQAEVTRLKERLEKSLRKTKPLSPVRAPPSAQGNCSHHNNTSTPRISHRLRARSRHTPTSPLQMYRYIPHSARKPLRMFKCCPEPSIVHWREREQHPSPHRSCQPTECLDGGGGVRAGYLAAPAPPVLGSVPLVHCVPVCPPPLLFYSSPVMKMDSYPQPFCVSVHSGGASTGVRGRHAGRSLSAGEQHSLNSSLDKAIRAARDMKHTSRRMARSLATGLHRTELLSQSCIY
ncbi:microtubule organization protein AKNA [Diretmus argenteus]